MFVHALALTATLDVPRATAPVIDGTIVAEEWKSATRVEAYRHRQSLHAGGEGRARAARVRGPFAPNEEQRIHVWPAALQDGCASIDLASGKTQGPYTFDRATWGMVKLH